MANPPDRVPSTSIVQVDRVRAGKPVQRAIAATIQAAEGRFPILILFTDWCDRKGDWRRRDQYRIEEIPTGIDGRAFLLHRDPAAIARDGPDADNRYGVFVHRNGLDQLCECKGFASHGRCKHVDALRRLIADGRL